MGNCKTKIQLPLNYELTIDLTDDLTCIELNEINQNYNEYNRKDKNRIKIVMNQYLLNQSKKASDFLKPPSLVRQ
jgi:hypothetical protein